MSLTPAISASFAVMMNNEQKAKASAFLVEKWGKGNPNGLPICSMCNDPKMSWGMGEHIVTPIVFANGGLNFGGAIYPMFAVICSNCGNTHYISALTAKLVVAPELKAPINPEPGDAPHG